MYNDLVMLKNSAIAAHDTVIDTVVDTAPYSNALDRSTFVKTSFHCPGRTLVIQVSNKPRPDETSDDDWVELGGHSSGEDFVWAEAPVMWMRVRGVETGDQVFVHSIFTQR